jgi:hypothetical protein
MRLGTGTRWPARYFGSSARCVGGRLAVSSSAGGPGSGDVRQPLVRGDQKCQVPAPVWSRALGQRRPAPVVQARPRTGSGDLGHGTACPRPPDGVPGRGVRYRSHHRRDEPRPVTVLARRCRLVGCGRWPSGSTDGGVRGVPTVAGGGQFDRTCPPRPRPSRPGSGVNASPDQNPWTDTSCPACTPPADLAHTSSRRAASSCPKPQNVPQAPRGVGQPPAAVLCMPRGAGCLVIRC